MQHVVSDNVAICCERLGISLSFIATICKFVTVVKNHPSRLFIIVKLLNLPCIIVGQNVYSSGMIIH